MREQLITLVAAASCLAAPARADFTSVWIIPTETGDGLVTFRLYANFTEPTDQLLAIQSAPGAPLLFDSRGALWNDGGAFAGTANEDLAGAPISGPRDSWVTIGHDEFAGNDTKLSPGFGGGDGLESVVRGDRWCDIGGGSWFDSNPATPALGPQVLIAQLTVPTSSTYEYFTLSGVAFWKSADGALHETDFETRSGDPIDFCPADVDYDRAIGFGDLLRVLSQWGSDTACLREDIDGNGVVNFFDLIEVLEDWAPNCDPHDP